MTEKNRKNAILAHSIAKKVASVENISYRGAIEILDHAKNILENNMKAQRAAVPKEIRDKWGTVVKVLGAETPSTKANVLRKYKGITVEIATKAGGTK